MWLIMIIAVIITIVGAVKEKTSRVHPEHDYSKGSQWEKDLYNPNMSWQERSKRLEQGYYDKK